MKRYILVVATAALFAAFAVAQSAPTVVGIRGPLFTINGHPTYTPEAGFPNADPNLIGTLLNVRAVQAVFDDANYPKRGTRQNPYPTAVMGAVSWDYPDTGKWDPERNTREFIAALPAWRQTGLLAFTVNLQGGGPTDGNYGLGGQPHDNSGFDADGNLKPAYAKRLQNIIAAADRNGMVVIVGLFYFGQDSRVATTPDDGNLRRAIVNGIEFLKSLPNRNIMVEINNEANPSYSHPLLRPNERLAEACHPRQAGCRRPDPHLFQLGRRRRAGGRSWRPGDQGGRLRHVPHQRAHARRGPSDYFRYAALGRVQPAHVD